MTTSYYPLLEHEAYKMIINDSLQTLEHKAMALSCSEFYLPNVAALMICHH